MVTTMFYHFLAPEGGHHIRKENFIEKNARSLFLSTTSKLNQQSSDMLFQKVQQIFTRLVMNTFP